MITYEELHQLFYCNNGILYNKINRSPTALEGATVGRYDIRGYLVTQIDKKTYLVHRIIWALYNGKWPNDLIDHINGIRDDNKIENLRDTSPTVNQQNRKNVKGYTKRGNKFRVRIMSNKKSVHIGYYNTEEEAHQAYLNAKDIYHKI